MIGLQRVELGIDHFGALEVEDRRKVAVLDVFLELFRTGDEGQGVLRHVVVEEIVVRDDGALSRLDAEQAPDRVGNHDLGVRQARAGAGTQWHTVERIAECGNDFFTAAWRAGSRIRHEYGEEAADHAAFLRPYPVQLPAVRPLVEAPAASHQVQNRVVVPVEDGNERVVAAIGHALSPLLAVR